MEGFYGKTPQYFEILLEKLNQKLQKTVEDVGDSEEGQRLQEGVEGHPRLAGVQSRFAWVPVCRGHKR